MPPQATYEDANLILRLYELRREPRLRQARQWFAQHFNATSLEEMNKQAPPNSEENASMRMLVSYWEMAASFVVAGVLNEELFFKNCGEMLVVWEKVRPLVPGIRAMTKNPKAFEHLEKVGNAYIKHMETRGPEAYAGFQAMLKMMSGGQ